MVPLGVLGAMYGVVGIFTGIALANVLAGIWAGYQMRQAIKKMNSTLVHANISNDYIADVTTWYHRLVK
jgi:hypothetical protein